MDIRPTTDRMKENLFNVLATQIPGSRFLDIFSGTGAIGIEALSRGAEFAVFVDNASAVLINKNLTLTGFTDHAIVLEYDYTVALQELNKKHMEFDIVFMDPPYKADYIPQTAELINRLGLLGPQGLLAVELAPNEAPPSINEMSLCKTKKYSTSMFFFFRKGF